MAADRPAAGSSARGWICFSVSIGKGWVIGVDVALHLVDDAAGVGAGRPCSNNCGALATMPVGDEALREHQERERQLAEDAERLRT